MAQPPSRSPTIFDIAKRSGLSKSTISAALLDNHRISTRTRARVRRLAARMGYTRNAFAATLATYGRAKPVRSLSVAIVSHVPADGGYELYDCSVIMNRLRELGYEGRHFDVFHDRISCPKLRQMLFNEGYGGVIFDQIYEKQSQLFAVDWSPFCLVCAGRTYQIPPCDIVRGNSWQAVSLAWRAVREAGYRRVGFALSRHQPLILDDSERESSLWICQQQPPRGEKVIPPFLGLVSDAASFEKWFRRHRPEVVVGFNSTHYEQLRSMGLSIPREVAYANLHGEGDGKLAGLASWGTDIRIKAAEHLDYLVRHRRTGFPGEPWELLAPVRWMGGESLPRLREMAAPGCVRRP